MRMLRHRLVLEPHDHHCKREVDDDDIIMLPTVRSLSSNAATTPRILSSDNGRSSLVCGADDYIDALIFSLPSPLEINTSLFPWLVF